jgi:hypothetical protein
VIEEYKQGGSKDIHKDINKFEETFVNLDKKISLYQKMKKQKTISKPKKIEKEPIVSRVSY